MRKIVDRIVMMRVNLREAFLAMDKAGTGFVPSREAFMQVLADTKVVHVLKAPEVKTLYRRFAQMTDTVDPPIDKRPICYQDFCDMAAYMRCSEYDGQSMSAKGR